ncbi:MAG: DUF6265 family protein [Pseudomonadales bacterium]|nr:DUF6265 family protein [Pseudomonadales bacterium]
MKISLKNPLMNFLCCVCLLGLSLLGPGFNSALATGPAASIADLDWMTGNWAGALGPNQLEENWIATEGGSIAALVRMTGNGGTSMYEMITIEEAEGSLVLHIQQWNPGLVPRAPAQKMELLEIGEHRVRFTATGTGGMRSLGYSKPTPDTFIIHVEQADGNRLDINLSARTLWQR